MTGTDPLSGNQVTLIGLHPYAANDGDSESDLLGIRCKDHKIDIAIDVIGQPLAELGGSDDPIFVPVSYKIGSNQPQTEEWGIMTSGHGAYYQGDAEEFIEKLISSDKLVVQVTPIEANPDTMVFDLAGLPNAITPLLSACNVVSK